MFNLAGSNNGFFEFFLPTAHDAATPVQLPVTQSQLPTLRQLPVTQPPPQLPCIASMALFSSGSASGRHKSNK